MKTVEEAREAFLEAMEDACIESCEHSSKDMGEHNITIAADVLGAARELRGHLRACERTGWNETDPQEHYCGDNYLCDVAKKLEEAASEHNG